MNYKILLIVGKILIITTLLYSALTQWVVDVWIAGVGINAWPIFANYVFLVLVGVLLCIYASKKMPNEQIRPTNIDDTIIPLFFKIVKWSAIVAIGFQLVATIVIAFFYCLSKEPEATLAVCMALGFLIWTISYVIEWMTDYNNKSKKEYEDHVLRVISVGTFSQDPVLEIYVRKNDGCIPRFFIRAYEKEWRPGKRFNACMRLRDDCFPYEHIGAEDNLTKEQRSQLFEYLGSGVGAYKNWHRLIDAWNYGNPDTPVPYDLKCYFIIT